MTFDSSKAFIYISDHWLLLASIESLFYDEPKKTIVIRTISGTMYRVLANASSTEDAAEYAKDWMMTVMSMVKRNMKSGDEEIEFPNLNSTF